jgi:hypothetical protein
MDSVVRCGELADWKPEKWPLQGLLQYLKHTDLKADDACTLCIQLLRAGATRTTLPEARKELTLNVVEALAHRKGGVRTVLEIRRRMAASYGLGYLAEREVVAVLDAWLAASHARVEL